MGRKPAKQPQRIAEKLRQVRLSLELTQDGMAKALERQGAEVFRSSIGLYEIGDRIPPVLVILAYARAANISMETLVDDELDLPK